MLYKLGRFLQLVGMLLLPVAIAGELLNKMQLWTSLGISAVGVAVFALGWLLQQATRPRG